LRRVTLDRFAMTSSTVYKCTKMGRRNLGELGENTLRVWASQEGATLNKANVDRSGWDFILEFPLDDMGARSEPDKRDEAYQCLIQVKSTDSLDRSPSVKLSNWKRLVETPLPAFFLILHFNGGDTCQSAFLVHVWESDIARVLKKARILGVKGQGGELHKHSLSLKWKSADQLPELTGRSLLTRIRKIVGPRPSEYYEKKLTLRKSVGYRSINAQVKARIIIPPEYRKRVPDELLVDLILGLVPEVKLAGGEIQDVRFGIAGKSSIHIEPGATLKLSGKPATSGTLSFRSKDRSHEVTVPADVIVPGGLRYELAPAARKFLLRVSYAELVVPAAGGELMFRFAIPQEDEQIPLEKAANLARILMFIHDAAESWEEGTIDIWLNEAKIGTAEISHVSLPKVAIEWAQLVLLARRVAVQLSLPSDLQITFRGLLAQRDALTIIHAAIDPVLSNLTFTFSVRKGASHLLDEQICFPIHVEISLGNSHVVVFESLLGTIKSEEPENGEYIVPVKRALIEKVLRLNPGESLPERREYYLNQIARARAGEGAVVWWWRTEEGMDNLSE